MMRCDQATNFVADLLLVYRHRPPLTVLLTYRPYFFQESGNPARRKTVGQTGSQIQRPRIINGEDAAEGRYPYFVRLLSGGSLCGGVLIGPNLVLTAAHVSETKKGDKMEYVELYDKTK